MVERAVGLNVVGGGELCNEGMLRKLGPTSPLDHFAAYACGSMVPYEFVQVPKDLISRPSYYLKFLKESSFLDFLPFLRALIW